ncbi:PD-(D/E)XK nuclease family protein [Phormidium sp. FACHB-1136]|uniref:PD-(D/E)XK nuclease family protein n=1 Tax=Phormidium sp. FACHB-1136 TaxID=2692848 RepID=UPI001683BF34|nr:PD-(D/E)XK nuclease family protein [Phormidium sp. FACHB-1136]MBD2426493.1 PD-(D/E)XK nuclease family protein [Phormidium sp. FACHB-1136]
MPLVTLTQGHLKLLELCPRRLQYTHLDQLAAPEDPEMLERQRWGTRFHLAMQQRELGLPLEPLLAQDPELATAIQALAEQSPDWFGLESNPTEPEVLRQSEHRRSLAWGSYELTVVYDLLRLTPHSGHIIDWKTYRQRPKKSQLTQDWQTRLYLYVLVETTDLDPAQLSMTYWFVPPPSAGKPKAVDRPGAVTLAYSLNKHRHTARDLRRLTRYLDDLLAAKNFPKVDTALGHCLRCPFALRCQRAARPADPLLSPIPTIDTIDEIPI